MSDVQLPASTKTKLNLRQVAENAKLAELSHLPLPEVEAVIDLVARTVPAGNVPGMILSVLAQVARRNRPIESARRDVNLLFKGVEASLERAKYAALFGGPAAVIWGYQNLLRLVGKTPDDAFPHGVWQFYVEYALREDTARHANETHGFDTFLARQQITLSAVDRMTAWTMAVIWLVHLYPYLLQNEWRERVYTSILSEITAEEPDAAYYAGLYHAWEKVRPYGRGADCPDGMTYPDYRREKFEAFMDESLRRRLPHELLFAWLARVEEAETRALPAFERQMSLWTVRQPDEYGETPHDIPLTNLHIGLMLDGRYYFLPACAPQTSHPADLHTVRGQIAALLSYPAQHLPSSLIPLTTLPRATQAQIRPKLSKNLAEELAVFDLMPVLLNFDQRPRDLPLSFIRRGERGIGDHALTIFDTGKTFVFDQSHIYFDGAWGAAFAEMLTQEAIYWAGILARAGAVQVGGVRPYSPVLKFERADLALLNVSSFPSISEASAESSVIKLERVQTVRRLLKQRNAELSLTVNDLLVLYRAIHAVQYRPHPSLVEALQTLQGRGDELAYRAAGLALEAIDPKNQLVPTTAIPIDGSKRSPRDRLYPMSFRVPLEELNLLELHTQTLEALEIYEFSSNGVSRQQYQNFEALQATYLATLAGFGAVLRKARDIANRNESVNITTLKLVASVPRPLQKILHQIPDKFDMLNDLLRGREIFSNVGQVVAGSTLTRFTSAKDDNTKKTLIWGVLTTAEGVLRVTLRDFRPHVSWLERAGRLDLAMWMTQDYLEAYTGGFNGFVSDLRRITAAHIEGASNQPAPLHLPQLG